VGYSCVPLPSSPFTIPVADLFALTSPSSSTCRRPLSMGFPPHQLHSSSSPHCRRLLSHGLHLSPPFFSPGSQLLAPLLRPTGQLFVGHVCWVWLHPHRNPRPRSWTYVLPMHVNIPDTSISSLGYCQTRAGEQQVCATGENSTLHHNDVWFTNWQLPLRIRLCVFPIFT